MNEHIESIKNQTIKKATSSLTNFAIAFESGQALNVEADLDEGEAVLTLSICQEKDLPNLHEAVCAVDWSWIFGSKVSALNADDTTLKFTLTPAGPLAVWAGIWQGKPFLAFRPHQKP